MEELEIIRLIRENPSLPIVPMVWGDVVGDDDTRCWMGSWGRAEVTEYYLGREHVHFKDDDEENVLSDMVGCGFYCTEDGRDILDLTDEEWNELYASIPWVKAIVVHITSPE